jgi:hypothetical protein
MKLLAVPSSFRSKLPGASQHSDRSFTLARTGLEPKSPTPFLNSASHLYSLPDRFFRYSSHLSFSVENLVPRLFSIAWWSSHLLYEFLALDWREAPPQPPKSLAFRSISAMAMGLFCPTAESHVMAKSLKQYIKQRIHQVIAQGE